MELRDYLHLEGYYSASPPSSVLQVQESPVRSAAPAAKSSPKRKSSAKAKPEAAEVDSHLSAEPDPDSMTEAELEALTAPEPEPEGEQT